MSLEINGSVQPYQNNPTPQRKMRKVPETVITTIRKNETPFSDEHFSLMQAAKKAGLPTNEQKKFADANADGIMTWGENSDPSPNDDKTVKQADYAKLNGKPSTYKLSAEQIVDLRNRVADYVARGGKLYTNKEVPTSLSTRVNERNGITPPLIGDPNAIGTNPLGETPKTHFSITLNNNGKRITNERILAQFAEDRYGGGNLWGENFWEIANMSADQGVKAQNVVIKPMGNKSVVYFDISPQDQLKIHENYKIVQEKVNTAKEIADGVVDKMALNQFLKGVFEGAWDSLKANWKMITNPIETAKGIIEAVKVLSSLSQEDLVNIVNQLKQAGHDLIFKDDVSEVANKAGKLVGALAVEIVLGKGIGVALRGLKGIKAIESLVNKVDDLSKVAKVKVAEAFSDDAAALARKGFTQKMSTQMYSGIPADALADLAVIATNKVGKGIVKFADFSRQMLQEFGQGVRPHLEKLYRDAMTKLGKNIDDVEINNTDVNQISPRRTITSANLNSVVVPGIRGGEFASWFNGLTKAEADLIWTNKALRATVEQRLRYPGEFHEWLPVSRVPKFKEWGIKAEEIWELRSKTKDLRFINPDGRHGGIGSGSAHNEIFALIDRANNFAEFKSLLQDWASRRLPNGVADLPAGLR